MTYKIQMNDEYGFSLEGDCLFCRYDSGYRLPINDIVSVTMQNKSVMVNMQNGDVLVFSKSMSNDQVLIFILLLFIAIIGGIIYLIYVSDKNEKVVDNAYKNVRDILEKYNSKSKNKVYDASVVVDSSSSPTSEEDKFEALKKWKDLLDQKIITEEEFKKQKDRIINDK